MRDLEFAEYDVAPMLETVLKNLKDAGLIHPPTAGKVVVAYSGGKDSTVLLHTLAEIGRQYPLEVVAAYYHHLWRKLPPRELPVLHKNCEALNIPLVFIDADRGIEKTEASARKHRYIQLTRLAADIGADAVLTAHHADDQVETVLFRIFRGTGLDGLTGIHKKLVLTGDAYPEARPVPILRPLLDISRQAIDYYAQEKGLQFFTDPTNADNRLQRNLIRNEILPALVRQFPQVKNSLFKLSLVAEGDVRILEDSMIPVWERICGEDEEGVYLDAVTFNQLGTAYQRRLIRRLLQQHAIEPDFQTIEELLEFIRGDFRHNLGSALKSLPDLPGGRRRFLALYKNRIRVIRPEAPENRGETTEVPVSDTAPVSVERPDLDIRVEFRPIEDETWLHDENAYEVTLARFANKPLVIRTRRAGDRFHAPGMTTRMRLKKYFINRAVPRFRRDHVPLLASGDVVLAVAGFALSEELWPDEDFEPTHWLKITRLSEAAAQREAVPPSEPIEEPFDEEALEGEDEDEGAEPHHVSIYG